VTQSETSSDQRTDLRQAARDHLWLPYSPPGLQGRAAEEIRILDRASGTRLWDVEGREYIDGISALEAMILEQGDAEIVSAMAAQAAQITFLDVFRWAARLRLSRPGR